MLIIRESLHRIGIGEVQLAVASQDVPGFGVAGLKRRAALDDFQFAGMNAMVGEPEPGGLIAEKNTARESHGQNQHARAVLDQ